MIIDRQMLWCQVTAYLDAFFPAHRWRGDPPYAIVAFSWSVYLDDGGKIRWRHRKEVAFAWPDERNRLIDEVMTRASYADVSICPNLMRDKHRHKGNSLIRQSAHSDVDDGFDARMEQRVREMPGGCAVYSGQPGHAHVYAVFGDAALLTDPLDLPNHEHLCRAVGDWFGAKDPKISDNDVMRLPGTWNFKPLAYDSKAEPLPVNWAVHPQNGYNRPSPTRLRQYMHIRKVDPSAERPRKSGSPGAWRDEPTEQVDLSARHVAELAAALGTDTGDRSADIMRVVGSCVRSGLTLPQSRWVVRSREDLDQKLDELTHDDVARCFAKASAACDDPTMDDNGKSSDEGNAKMNDPKSGRTISWRTAAQIKDRRPEWAWTHNGGGRLPRSALSLFAARPGVGKSTAARWFAAGFTRGTIEGCFYGHPQNVAYIASEESLEAMVKPSLRAVDADMDRIHFPKVEVDGQLVRLLSVVDEARLTADFIERGITVVIVDPVMSTVGGKADINRNNETRDHLEPWARMAEATNGLTLGIVHLVKVPGGDIVAAINGSSAFGEVARAVIAFAQDTQSGDGTGVLSQEKNNAGRIDLALEYGIESASVQTDDLLPAEVGRFVLGGEADRRVSDLLRTNSAQEKLGERSREVVDVVRNAGTAVGAEVVAAGIEGMSRKDASQYLTRLVKMGFLTRAARGLYEYRRTLGDRLRESEESVVNQ